MWHTKKTFKKKNFSLFSLFFQFRLNVAKRTNERVEEDVSMRQYSFLEGSNACARVRV